MDGDINERLERIEASAYTTITAMTTPDEAARLIAAIIACDVIDDARDTLEE